MCHLRLTEVHEITYDESKFAKSRPNRTKELKYSMHPIQRGLIGAYLILFVGSAVFIAGIVYAGVLQANNELEELPTVITLSSHRRDLLMLSIHWLREFYMEQQNTTLSYLNMNPTSRYYSSAGLELQKSVLNLHYTESLLIQSPIKISER
jgi:hypothetical protein